MKKILVAVLFIIAAASFAFADTLYLRDGRTVHGTVLGFVNGQFVVRVEAGNFPNATTDPNVARRRRDAADIQYFRPDEIDRIEIEGRSLDDARYQTRNVQVGLDANWIDSGVFVRRGERVQISATGVITVGRTRITPDGLQRSDPSAPMPNANEGELIGAIGNDPNAPMFELGSNREFTADRNGRIFLTANRGSYADARGSFDVQIRRERSLNARDTDELDRGTVVRSRNRQLGLPPRGSGERTIEVPGNSRGMDTGIDVRSGDQITFSASGTVVAGQRAGSVGPEGKASSGFGGIIGTRPVPNAGVGALVGYIRTTDGQQSQWFFVGSQLTFNVPADGRLYLAINDDNYNDNSGSFTVRIRY
jgi:hypothetical protein